MIEHGYIPFDVYRRSEASLDMSYSLCSSALTVSA